MKTRMYAVITAMLVCMTTAVQASQVHEAINIPSVELNFSKNINSTQFAAVHFLGYEGDLSFGNSGNSENETNSGSKWCRNNGYTKKSCGFQTALTNRCPQHPTYYQSCTTAQWCMENDYKKLSTSCVKPEYPNPTCPSNSAYTRACVQDIPRACKEENGSFVHSSTCPADWRLQDSPKCSFDNQYGNCCNQCTGYDYVNIPDGYVSGGSCASCTGTKHKITCNPCSGYSTCEYGPDVGSGTCNSCGTTKYNKCKTVRQVCAGKGYDQTSCGTNYDMTSCPDDGTYKKCVATCESKLVEAGYKVNTDGYNAVITKNTTFYSVNSNSLQSVEAFRTRFPTECSTYARPKPTLTFSLSGNPSMSYKTYTDMGIRVIGASDTTMNGSTFTNAPLEVSGNITLSSGRLYYKTDSNKSKSNFKANNVRLYGGASLETNGATMNLRGLFVWNTSNVWISNTSFTAEYLETITSDSRVDFAGSSSIYVRNTFIGGIENYGGQAVYRRGAVIRVRDTARWYMYYGNVRVRDAALFCAGYGGKIMFNGTTKGYDWGEFDGCRIYNDKDRTLSNGDWDPSSYTSWSNRGGC